MSSKGFKPYITVADNMSPLYLLTLLSRHCVMIQRLPKSFALLKNIGEQRLTKYQTDRPGKEAERKDGPYEVRKGGSYRVVPLRENWGIKRKWQREQEAGVEHVYI